MNTNSMNEYKKLIIDAQQRLYKAYNDFDNCTDNSIRGMKDSIIHRINSIEIELENLYQIAKKEQPHTVPHAKQLPLQTILYTLKGVLDNGKRIFVQK